MPRRDSPHTGRTKLGGFHLGRLSGTARDGLNRKRSPRKRGEPEPMPVEPDKPKGLSGGAAVALEFDD